jgi:chitinase
MPANQITLGVPAYGYLQMSSASRLIQRRGGISPRDKLPHRKASSQAHEQKRASYVTVYNDGGGTSDGQVMFEELVSQGALTKDSSGEYAGAGGFVREWDGCSSTVSRATVSLRYYNVPDPHPHSHPAKPTLIPARTCTR